MDRFGLLTGLLVSVLLVASAAPAPAAPGSITATLRLTADDLSVTRSDGFDIVRLEDSWSTREVGLPELPVRVVRFALPEGAVALSAQARVLSEREIPGAYLVRPRQPEVPYSRPEAATWIEPDPSAYASPLPYPAERCELLGTGNASGQAIASVAYYPVRYIASSGKLEVSEVAEITVQFEPSRSEPTRHATISPEAAEVVAQRMRALVVNGEDVPEPSTATRGSRAEVDYLIITSSAYEATFQTLADWKEQKGLTTDVVTTSWIYANYPGVDSQDQIRNCIIDYYENKGTIWVLLGGDTGVVPARIVYAMTSGAGGGADEDKIRCDLYYGDLDGTWDANGDGVYGQIQHDDIDMYADVFVGRAPVDNSTEAARFVEKALTYEGAPGGSTLPTDYQEDVLFMAEVLWTDPWTDHAVCKNMIDDDSVPALFDPITKLYQTSGNLSRSSAVAAMNDGYNIVNHNGHANTSVLSIGSGGLYRSDFDGLTNAPSYGLFYSLGCWSAAIDYDCIAEHWNNSPGGGGAFYIGNSRYGWGSPGNPGYGTGDEFDREFFNVLFNQGLEHAGVAHAAHKDAFVATARSDGYTRYTLYELNLLGDPESLIWTSNPVGAAVVHPSTIPLGLHPLLITVSRDGSPVEGASVYLSNEEVFLTATTAADGVASLQPSPSVEGTLNVTVTGAGILPYTDTIDVTSQPPDTDAPAQVDNLIPADPFDVGGVVLLDWTAYVAPSDFAQYRVYRSTERFWDVNGMTPLTSALLDPNVTEWTDTTVENGTAYYYAVTATDLSGNERTEVLSRGPVAATVNSRILVWDADDGDTPFDGIGDDYGPGIGTEVPWIEALDAIGELYSVSSTLPADLEPFDLIIYLGGIINFGDPEANVPMTEDQILDLTAFIDSGGDVYVEEPMFGGAYYVNGSPAAVELWNRFHSVYVVGQTMSEGNVASLAGQAGTPTQSMSLPYDFQDPPDQFVAEIGPDGGAGSSLLWGDQLGRQRGSLYVDAPSGCRRYMVPVLLGGMTDVDAPSTRLDYVTRILEDSGLIGTAGIDGPSGSVGRLEQNAPNPFNPQTTIRYSVSRQGARVVLAIYDVAGRRVNTIADGPREAGDHAVIWDGTDELGRPVASGVYFCRLSIDGASGQARKMVLLK
ncbi:MAG: hypothetical protein JXB46_01945 [Candidatus Eisenbacteria bacterium]|nr:hypothetical protein [Candidatus Eisenbacteria bacterium]